jgi:hypothetical protein
MKTPALFLIGRHPVDLLRLAIKLTPVSDKPLLVCMTEGNRVAPIALGQNSANEYAGLAGIMAKDRSEIVRTVACEGRTLDVIFPASHSYDSASRSETIDRARDHLGAESQVVFLIDTNRITKDLPPLANGDSVQCIWELRDPMDSETITAFQALRTRLEHYSAEFRGIQLYARNLAAAEEAAERAAEIREFSNLCNDDIIILDETPAAPVINDPSRLEILGVLAHKLIHSLGNDLSCIAGNIQIGQQSNMSAEELRSLFSDVVKSVDNATETLTDLRKDRKSLFSQEPLCSPGTVRDALTTSLKGLGKWTVNIDLSIPGSIRGDVNWLTFTIRKRPQERHDFIYHRQANIGQRNHIGASNHRSHGASARARPSSPSHCRGRIHPLARRAGRSAGKYNHHLYSTHSNITHENNTTSHSSDTGIHHSPQHTCASQTHRCP